MSPKPDEPVPTPSTPQQQSWGAIIAMVVILAMIIIGAFYSWQKRTGVETTKTFVPAAQTEATTTIHATPQ